MHTSQFELTDTVEKDILPTLIFASEDVLDSVEMRRRRHMDANRATALGNNYHGKLDIYFLGCTSWSLFVYRSWLGNLFKEKKYLISSFEVRVVSYEHIVHFMKSFNLTLLPFMKSESLKDGKSENPFSFFISSFLHST